MYIDMFQKGTRQICTKGHFCTKHFCMKGNFCTRVEDKNIYRKKILLSQKMN